MSETLLGWHFVREDGTTGYLREAAHVGQVLHVDPPIVPCERGLHASVRVLDALQYAKGAGCCRVELSGLIVPHEHDKHAASDRRVLAMVDATGILHEFACRVAEQALTREREAGREPDPSSWAAIEAKRRWLRGEISDFDLDADWSAARAASGVSAWSSAWSAARVSAWDADWSASMAGASAWSASGVSAMAAAMAAMNADLEAILLTAMGLEVTS